MQRSSTQVIVLLAIVAGLTAGPDRLTSQTAGDYISGRVVSEGAVPEAGVWVVAESKDVMPNDGRGPDSYRKIVVTDDAGRFLLPDLPSGSYDVWVRGYGLVDSRASWTLSGQHIVAPGTRDLQITVETAQTPQEAARVYPANYWYSLLNLPPATAFPGDGEHIGSRMASQSEWVGQLKLSCNLCHQIGTSATRLATRGAWDVAMRKSPNMLSGANSFG